MHRVRINHPVEGSVHLIFSVTLKMTLVEVWTVLSYGEAWTLRIRDERNIIDGNVALSWNEAYMLNGKKN